MVNINKIINHCKKHKNFDLGLQWIVLAWLPERKLSEDTFILFLTQKNIFINNYD